MKGFFLTGCFCMICFIGTCQEIPAHAEEQLENQAAAEQNNTEDDSYAAALEQFRRHPINLNRADADELHLLPLLNELQIATLLAYRHQLGPLLNMYELQAIPAWDLPTIRRLLPYITLATPFAVNDLRQRFRKGEHSLLLRVSQAWETPADPETKKFTGSSQHLFLRYRYSYKNLLQYGLTADKDPGEPFFKGVQKTGFDFYSFHFFARRMGIIHSLALGDFTVNMGQGLIQWQGLAFQQTPEVMMVRRQSPVLRPYTSAGEYNFHRGAGITLQKANTSLTVFISRHPLSANGVDSSAQGAYFTSFLTSGYHRTASELADRHRITQSAAGFSGRYQARRWQAGINGVVYHFSLPLQKRDEPYNLYAIHGNSWYNISVDYSGTFRNLHFFGETAFSPGWHTAFLHGLLISAGHQADIALVHRFIGPACQALNANAFTENTSPTNEEGLYAGITLRPRSGWRIDAYADLYRFPWLRYQAAGPGWGSSYLLQVSYSPNKQLECYTRFRRSSKSTNGSGSGTGGVHPQAGEPLVNWRIHINYRISRAFTLRQRTELSWFRPGGEEGETGFLLYSDLVCKPPLSPFSGAVRLQYFETQGYNSRIYAYETDVPGSYSIPAFYGQGFHFYMLANADAGKKLSFWARFGSVIYQNKNNVSGNPPGPARSFKNEVKIQARIAL